MKRFNQIAIRLKNTLISGVLSFNINSLILLYRTLALKKLVLKATAMRFFNAKVRST